MKQQIWIHTAHRAVYSPVLSFIDSWKPPCGIDLAENYQLIIVWVKGFYFSSSGQRTNELKPCWGICHLSVFPFFHSSYSVGQNLVKLAQNDQINASSSKLCSRAWWRTFGTLPALTCELWRTLSHMSYCITDIQLYKTETKSLNNCYKKYLWK